MGGESCGCVGEADDQLDGLDDRVDGGAGCGGGEEGGDGHDGVQMHCIDWNNSVKGQYEGVKLYKEERMSSGEVGLVRHLEGVSTMSRDATRVLCC